MNATTRLAIAGFGATAVGFGPARMGFGLFLPKFRADFDISTETAGLIASAGFMAFLAALPLAAVLALRTGYRMPVVLGGISALIGFVLVAMAQNVVALGLGIVFAGASAGFCWSPFDGAVERTTSDKERGSVLSIIATGTAIGVVLAGALSLAVSYRIASWPIAWWIFAIAAMISTAVAVVGVPGPGRTETSVRPPLSDFFPREVAPLYAVALVFGATNSVFVSFAADHVDASGGLAGLSQNGASAIIFISYGTMGLLGLVTSQAEDRFGLEVLLRLVFAAAALSMTLVALAPTDWLAIVVASGTHGAALMAVSAIISFWSLRLFPHWGTIGFTIALVWLAIGNVIGPFLAGRASEAMGGSTMFLLAAVPAFLICAWPRRLPIDRKPAR